MIIGVICFFIFSGNKSQAGIQALEAIYKSLGSQVNYSTPGAFQDQAAGYYTAGGLYMRNRPTTIQPLQISLPHIGMGCNGLDLYMGAFSFMKGEQLTQMLRSLGTAAPSYAMQLALKTMAPQVENLLSQLRKVTLDMNAMMLDSCHASQQMVGGLWPSNTAASEQICQDVTRSGGEDWFGARKHCEKPEAIQGQLEKVKSNPQNKDLLQGEYNLTWHVVKEKLGYDEEMAHFMLTTVGTVIARKEGHRYRVMFIEAMADDNQFIEAYLKGGKTQERFCRETDKCLEMGLKDLNFLVEKSLTHKVFQKITTIRSAYEQATPLKEEDISFLNDTAGLPIYRYIEVSVAAKTQFLLLDACEHIAFQLLLSRFESASREILMVLDQLKAVQLDDQVIKAFQEQIQHTRSRLLTLQMSSKSHTLKYFNDAIQAYENMIIARETF